MRLLRSDLARVALEAIAQESEVEAESDDETEKRKQKKTTTEKEKGPQAPF